MKKIFRIKTLFLLALVSMITISCDNDDDGGDIVIQQFNIVQTAQNSSALSSLVAALTKADEKAGTDLIGTLSGTGPFTVFAPTNDAFTALLGSLEAYNSLDDFTTDEDKALLASILTYHVVAASALSSDLSDGQNLTTVQGEQLTVGIDGSTVTIKDKQGMDIAAAVVSTPNIETSNGIVHVIDAVLLPQEVIDAINAASAKSLVEIVVETEALSVLEAVVIKADLVDTLNGDGPFTVFAPTDDAFTALLDALGDDYNSLDDFDTEDEMNLLKDILLYHVIPAKVLEADLSAGEVATALTDNKIEVIASGNTYVIGDASDVDAEITGTDIMASNGVAHTINKVLLPQAAIDFVASLTAKNIVETAQETEDLSLLVDALVQADAGLVDVLSGDGPFTVFAPTNAAFAELLDILGDDYNSLTDFDTEDEKSLLAKVLTYHVVSGVAALSTDLSDGQMIETVQEESVEINIKNDMVHIIDATDENATVDLPNVETSNGVVHVIDKVLLPQEVLDLIAHM